MALTITKVHDPDGNDQSCGVFDVTFDNSYTANGYVLAASMVSRKALYTITPVQTGTANRIITYDPTTGEGKLRIWTALGTEAAGASDQSTISCRCRVVGPTA